MAPALKTLLRSSFSFLLAALFLYVAFRGTDFSDLWDSLISANYFWIVLLVPIGIASHYVRALRWKFMLGHLKEGISTRNLFSAVMIGYMINNVLPRVGELVRPYVAGKLEGISKSSALGTVVIERIVDMIAFFAILCSVLFLFPGSLSVFVSDVESLRPLFLLGSVVSLLLFVLLFLKSETVFRSIKIFLAIVPATYKERVGRIIESFLSGFKIASMRREFWKVALLSLLMWGLYALGLYVSFFAFRPIAEADLDFSAAVILLTLSTVAYVIPVPGAFGTYHSFLKYALVQMYGIDDVTALSYSLLTHELGVLTVTVVGVYFFLKDHVRVSDISLETGSEKPVQS